MRFSLRNLLLAILWFAAWGALLVNTDSFMIYDGRLSNFADVFLAAMVVLPCVAVGTLLGNAKKGAMVGAVALIAVKVADAILRHG